MVKISLNEMIDSGVHFGHQVSKWHPKNKSVIFGSKNGVHIFDVHQTAQRLAEALQALHQAASSGKTILLVSTKLQSKELIQNIASDSGMPCITERWLGGFLTNFDTIKTRIKHLIDLEKQFESGEIDKYTKKEQVMFSKEIKKLNTALGGVKNMTRLPDMVFVVDGIRDRIAIDEARKRKIPVVGICDSNVDPRLYTHPIPANDDGLEALNLIIGKVGEVIISSKKAAPKPKTKEATDKKASPQAEKKPVTKPDSTKSPK